MAHTDDTESSSDKDETPSAKVEETKVDPQVRIQFWRQTLGHLMMRQDVGCADAHDLRHMQQLRENINNAE